MRTETWESTLEKYLGELRSVQTLARGEAEPEAQLIPLVKRLLEEAPEVRVLIEARPQEGTRVGKPDFGVKHKGLLVGFVELKAPGKGANPDRYTGHDREQWERFRHLPNLVYTDGWKFALFREGKRVREADLDSKGGAEALRELLIDFLNWKPLVPKNPKELARFLAPLTRFLREAVLEAVKANPNGELARLREEWRKNLLPEGDERVFTDAYAQLITYGFLLARALDRGEDGEEEPLYLERALELLEGRYGLLMEALFVANHPRLLAEIRPAYDLLRRSLRTVSPSAFRSRGVDPWLYFYEDFLAEYDPELRKDMGVYYTPIPVVRAMVRLVDEVLKGGFGLETGLADERVTLLDPAMGTGTFLLAALEKALENVTDLYGEGYRGQYAGEVASRLHGIELMLGPYAVAQLRLSQAVQAEGGSLPEGGLNLYLADTLEAPEAPPLEGPFFYERLAEERKRAADLKREKPILVVLGNPPYDRVEGEDQEERERKGGWVLKGPREPHPLMEDFLQPARRAGLEIHLKNLYNLYVYFWRFALWKAFEQDPGRGGVLCLITPSSYLRGPAFAGMRGRIRRQADEVYILDLGGEGRGAVREENVFNIQTPVAIALVVRRGPKDHDTPARVFYHRLAATTREGKLRELESLPSLKAIPFREAPGDWQAPFVPEVGGEWARWPRLTDLFPWQHSGVEFKRTWPIGPTREVLAERWAELLKAPSEEKPHLFREERDRKVDRAYPGILTPTRLPPLESFPPGKPPEAIVRYGYRSFDRAWAIADGRVCSRPRPPLWRAQGDRQIYLTSLLTAPLGKGPALVATHLVPDYHYFCNRGGKDIIPLFRDAGAKDPNISRGLLEVLEEAYGFPVSPEDFAAYVYALLAQPAYTERFAEELRTPGPRVPVTKDPDLFRKGVELGSHLLWLHTYGERYAQGRTWPPQGKARWAKAPSTYPEEHRYDPERRTLYVGDGEVKDVAPEVYGFEVSGFFPVKNWLGFRQRNRRGRRSSDLDEIAPSSWTSDLGRELLELLWILEKTLETYPQQEELLRRVLAAPLFSADELPAPTPEQREAPEGGADEPQEAEEKEGGGDGVNRAAQPPLFASLREDKGGAYGDQP